ncbi:MAG: pyruvate kinase [Chloroflexota bacterium]|nr:pyruvate kinase [Chloroflexota bacterium]
MNRSGLFWGTEVQEAIMNKGRRAKIVATLGPATDAEGMLEWLLLAGVDVVRLNFSHGSHAEHAERIRRVRIASEKLGQPVAIMQDLQGPKIRTGSLVGGKVVELRPGAELRITTRPVEGTAERVSTTYEALPRDCRPGDTILINDGRMRLTVLESSADEVRAQVVDGGPLGEHKGINLPGVAVSAPALTEKDKEDLAFGLAQGVDYAALSFVREAADLQLARTFMEQCGASVPLIAKIEKPQAIAQLDAIIAASDGVMVARGDLGVELPAEDVPPLQKRIIGKANRRGIPVITATQMLESMISEPTPTRAEASDVANAIWDGTDAVMLSAETAAGAFPVEVVEMMHRIVIRAEAAARREDIEDGRRMSDSRAISHAARSLAENLNVAAIVAFTRTGRTAHLLSRDRPRVPIYAFTPTPAAYRRLALWWGVTPIMGELPARGEALIEEMEAILLERGAVVGGDRLVIVGGFPFRRGVHANFVKLHATSPRRSAVATVESRVGESPPTAPNRSTEPTNPNQSEP